MDECISEDLIYTKKSLDDKRKITLSLSSQVIDDFENVLWSQLN